MPKPSSVSLRVRVSLPLYERIGEYRHTARHDSKQQALRCIICAGLAALAKPAAIPSAPDLSITGGYKANIADRPKRLVAYAGKGRQ